MEQQGPHSNTPAPTVSSMTGGIPAVQEYRSPFACYAVKFSPFNDTEIAIATSQFYGIVGNGRQYIVRRTPSGLVTVRSFDTQDGCYDCTWNEMNRRQVVSVCADGSIKLWDMASRDPFPIAKWKEHQKEAACVDWNGVS